MPPTTQRKRLKSRRKQPVDLWKLPVLLALLVLAAEWWVYNKRVSI